MLFLAGALAFSFWAKELTAFTFVPRTAFVEPDPLGDNAYDDTQFWISRPGTGQADAANWVPDNFKRGSRRTDAAVFFVHPTSFLESSAWNGAIGDAASQDLAGLYVRAMASPFNSSANIWAPRYRQAAIGAFLTQKSEGKRAIDTAYADVEQAFDYFVRSIDANTPIVLAGHSQGALHLRRLLKDRIAGTPLVDRIAAAYLVGWPLSLANDLPSMGLPACATPDQNGCIMSWSSFAEPAEPEPLLEAFDSSRGLNERPNAGGRFLCSNPLTGTAGGAAPATANLGTLIPNDSFTAGRLVPAAVPARCDGRGLLLVGDPPEMGNAVLPGNNYHIYDIPLFWANLRQDFERRVSSWQSEDAQAAR
ncbi:DUF3089 domain-containing protein [Croceicoccus sp. F390]|uniref:DUF3089 domain-containing protein n=1 Tax=Croceicoccus esteveae TaxID=3075597 RepID=A0ABU2ZF86_9SPHN|nr:DUF3089 domain-containing protein [Croceicoccus sp. F390]MDT0575260.1 DUF3089 domain-containing protein [Croceicoccus sp. F390]